MIAVRQGTARRLAGQAKARWRSRGPLAIVQPVTALSMLRVIVDTDPARFERLQRLARPEFGSSAGWSPVSMRRRRRAAAIATAVWLLRPRNRIAGIAATASFALFQRSIQDFHRPFHNYNTHIEVFAGTETVARSLRPPDEAGGFWLVESLTGLIYLQSAVAKVRHGGPNWVREGRTVSVAASELGRGPLRRALQRREVAAPIAAGTVVLEFVIWPVLRSRTGVLRTAGVAALMLFHLGNLAVIRISFWHLLVHDVALLTSARGPGRPGRNSAGWHAALAAAAIGGAVATVRDRHRWPFCSYSMFAHDAEGDYPQLRVRLIYPESESDILDARGLLPLEFFRTLSILEHVYFKEQPESLREECASIICNELNNHPWRQGDEVCPSLRSAGDPPVVGFDLFDVKTSVRQLWEEQAQDPDRRTLLYSYRIPTRSRTDSRRVGTVRR